MHHDLSRKHCWEHNRRPHGNLLTVGGGDHLLTMLRGTMMLVTQL